MKARKTLLSAAVLGLLAGLAQPGVGQTGAIEGVVHDSLGGGPLADAAVFLWETSYRAETDDQGRFRIEGVAPGPYSILFFHRRLGEMGLSAGPQSIVVEQGRTLEIDLATPSRRTITRSECLMDGGRPDGGIVTGHVVDSGSQMTLGGAGVTLSWHPRDARTPSRLDARTGPDGWFHTCEVPKGVPILVSAGFYGRESRRQEIVLDDSGFIELPIALEELGPSRLAGQLKDRETGRGVEGAETWLRGTHLRALTDARGNFLFESVPAGTYMLMTDHLAYGTKMDTLVVPDRQRLAVEMLLDTRPIEIAPLTVTTDAPPVEMARRRGGHVITRAEIDEVRQRSRDASDIIRSLHVPGVLVRHNSNGTICVGYITGQVMMNQDGCVEMLIYINDVRATDPNLALRLPPDAIDRMVLYKPVEAGNLFGLGGGNGVWLIYTRGN